MKDIEKDLRRHIAAEERGTWREALRSDYAPWFDALTWGFQCGDGWRDIVCDLTREIANVVGGPDRMPRLRVTQVKQKFGGLRFYLLSLPAAHSVAIDAAIRRAEARSERICETCGGGGRAAGVARRLVAYRLRRARDRLGAAGRGLGRTHRSASRCRQPVGRARPPAPSSPHPSAGGVWIFAA